MEERGNSLEQNIHPEETLGFFTLDSHNHCALCGVAGEGQRAGFLCLLPARRAARAARPASPRKEVRGR